MASLAFRRRSRANSLSANTPPKDSPDFDLDYARLAAKILYKSPLRSSDDLPIFVLDSAALPDANDVHYGSLLPYVLAHLPTEEQLIDSKGYEVIVFAGGEEKNVGQSTKARPPWSFFLQAYQVLSRAMRKRLQKLYLVHERRWIRVMLEMFSTVVSPKSRRKIVHCSTMTSLALRVPIEQLLIPPSAYERDRQLSPDIHVPYATGRRAFGARNPFPTSTTSNLRLPRVLREASVFVLEDENVRCEGIFRVNARAQTLEILREAYDRGQKFIVWKELDRTQCFGAWQDGHGEVRADELDQLDGYNVYSAAGLIKLWYSKLREPLFGESTYPYLEHTFGEAHMECSAILNLICPSSEWSPLSKTSRQILNMHLFPFLARVAHHSAENKMTAGNLAVCFAPALVCGPDPIEDAKISRILIKIIEYTVDNWRAKFDKPCEMDNGAFDDLLATPAAGQDWEDPLEAGSTTENENHEQQLQGIAMIAKDESSSSDEMEPPELPPRVLLQSEPLASEPIPISAISSIRRKPAPPLQAPPRYSTIVSSPIEGSQTLPPYAEHHPVASDEGESAVEAAMQNFALDNSEPAPKGATDTDVKK